MALGKGLGSLIPQQAVPVSSGDTMQNVDKKDRVWHIPLSEIVPNPQQPRKHFDADALDRLVQSIKTHGVMQPIVVTERPDGGYELIAGERRFRASKKAALPTIPAIVKNVGEQDKLALAIIENIQRQELNAIEEAFSYRRLMDEFGLTQQQVADQVGKSRSAVANMVRLLDLPEVIQEAVIEGKLSMGKARALLSIEDAEQQLAMFTSFIGEGISVRAAEQQVQQEKLASKKGELRKDPNIIAQERLLEERIGSRVQIKKGKKGKGTVVISYYSDEELGNVLRLLAGEE